jgi:hypothetical protein
MAGTGRWEKRGADCASQLIRNPDLHIIDLSDLDKIRQMAGIFNVLHTHTPAGTLTGRMPANVNQGFDSTSA